jgi:glycosyltransferase involved in cell wall biosynthesis
MITCLKDDFRITVAARGCSDTGNLRIVQLPASKKAKLKKKILFAFNLKAGRFNRILWPDEMKITRDALLGDNYDLIVCHDLNLLPLALSVKKNAKVLFDAREYYPRHYEDRFFWRFFYQGFNKYLCRQYLHRCDAMITICDGISREYYKNYGVKSDVIMSLPFYVSCRPSRTEPDKVKMIYHGNANPSRRTELMIEVMDYVDERFSLDLMLMPSDPSYLKKLISKAAKRKNVRIIPPVSYNEIVPFTSRYDIGLCLFPPSTFNLKYVLANKFFECIQARLAIAIGPSIEMAKIVKEWDCGIVAGDFEPKTLADELNKLTSERIMYYKQRSDKAALHLSAESNIRRIGSIVDKLLTGSRTADSPKNVVLTSGRSYGNE